jgi:hypothetical protein
MTRARIRAIEKSYGAHNPRCIQEIIKELDEEINYAQAMLEETLDTQYQRTITARTIQKEFYENMIAATPKAAHGTFAMAKREFKYSEV